jgi:hypothetical protein
MRIRDPGWQKFGSGMNIPDPQYPYRTVFMLTYIKGHLQIHELCFMWTIDVSAVSAG